MLRQSSTHAQGIPFFHSFSPFISHRAHCRWKKKMLTKNKTKKNTSSYNTRHQAAVSFYESDTPHYNALISKKLLAKLRT